MSRIRVFVAVALLTLFATPPAASANGEIWLDRDSARIEVGSRLVLHAETRRSGDIWWETSDHAVADIAPGAQGRDATVRAWRPGTATVYAHFAPFGSNSVFTAICRLTVIANSNPRRAAAVRLTPESLLLGRGESRSLTAEVFPDTAVNRDVDWESSDPSTIAVDRNGTVAALRPGRAWARVVTRDGGHRAECDVEVVEREIRVEGIVLNHASSYVIRDETRHLIAYITPENATNKKVYWSTSNPNIASVSRTGIVVGVRRGIAIISAMTEDGGFVAECEMEVRDGWLDFVGGCATLGATPAALVLVIPLICLLIRR